MIQQFGQRHGKPASRRGIAVLLALWLNLLLLPCAMALETQDTGHDCCPPSIELQAFDCCELDAVSPDGRDGKFDNLDDATAVLTGNAWPSLQTLSFERQVRKPPDPEHYSPPRHQLFCVYLN